LRINAEASAKFIRVFKALSKEQLVNPNVSSREKPKRDLGLGTVKRLTKDCIVLITHRSDRTCGDVFNFENIASVDPEMAIADSGTSALSNAHLAFFYYRSHANLHARF
jgi:hypothetical protein